MAAAQPCKVWLGNLRLAVSKWEVRDALAGLGLDGIKAHEDAVVIRNPNSNRVSFGFVEFEHPEQACCSALRFTILLCSRVACDMFRAI